MISRVEGVARRDLPGRRAERSGHEFGLTLLVADVAAVAGGTAGASLFGSTPAAPPPAVLAGVAVAAGLLVVLFYLCEAYRIEGADRVGVQLGRTAPALLALGLLAALLARQVADPAEWPGAWLAEALVATGLLLGLSRALLTLRWRRLQRTGELDRRVALVGGGPLAERVARAAVAGGGLKVVGRFGEEVAAASGEGLHTLERLVRTGGIDEVVVTLPWRDEAAIVRVADRLSLLTVDVSLAGGPFGAAAARRAPVAWVGGVPCVRILSRPLGGREALAKSLSDRLLAGGALLLAAPLLALVALAVRLDSPGPALYRQKRHGLNGRVIEILKFRTMYAERCDDGTGAAVAQAREHDPRITRVGYWLRRTSLDELPQLVNVLRGEMSVVGPRPHAVAHNERFEPLIERYAARHRVKPGITGWAQVHGLRGETDTVEKMAQRVAYDLEYIESWSLALDLRIILKTLFVGFVHPEAR